MDTSENELTPSDSLKLITEVISKTRDNIKTQSFCFLLWGWLIAAASILFYVLHEFTAFKLFFLPFPLLVIPGIIITVIYYQRSSHFSETYLTGFLKQLWLVLAISFIAVVLISLLQKYPPFTYTLVIGGIGTLVSGLVMRFRPLIVGGALFLLIAVGSVFVGDGVKPLLQGIAVIAGYLIPGYLLKYSKS
ncbi:MAG TPA: hypothetical protein VFE53_02145 [Mucilaginibacter sp.]|nr:hypothetical protein [Mucilaginibacter sp.]